MMTGDIGNSMTIEIATTEEIEIKTGTIEEMTLTREDMITEEMIEIDTITGIETMIDMIETVVTNHTRVTTIGILKRNLTTIERNQMIVGEKILVIVMIEVARIGIRKRAIRETDPDQVHIQNPDQDQEEEDNLINKLILSRL